MSMKVALKSYRSVDLKSISQSLYRQRLKEYLALPKDRMETHACLENLAVKYVHMTSHMSLQIWGGGNFMLQAPV
jgi:hypothetical protein